MAEVTNEPWDDTYPFYLQQADFLRAVAEAHCGAAIDDVTHVRWRELLGIMREIDTRADDSDAANAEIIDELRSFDRFAYRYPHLTPDQLGTERHARLVTRTQRIFELGACVAEATTVVEYKRFRTIEAVETAAVFADSATDEVLAGSSFNQKFMPLLRSLGIAACMVDSAHDLADDYASGRSVIKPTRLAKARVLAAAVPYIGTMIKAGMHKDVLKEAMIAARLQRHRRKKVNKG